MASKTDSPASLYPVVLSGGAGTRLWPLSRALYPKQLHRLVSDRSLFQETVARVAGRPGFAPALVICNEQHRFLIAEHLRELEADHSGIVLEPTGRNTAPAAAVAAIMARERDASAVIAILPSDHVIENLQAFHEALEAAVVLAADGHLVTFGIVPTKPATGYGYIEKGTEEFLDGRAFRVARFVEKPDAATAQSYLEGGGHYWNSGIFVFRADAFLDELGKWSPEIAAAAAEAVAGGFEDLDFFRLEVKAFTGCPSDSIDYAVMENTESSVVIPVDMGWSDLGSWSALWSAGTSDGDGNVKVGDVVAEETADSYLRAESRLVATLGVSNLAVVETADAVLVSGLEHAEHLRRLVDRLKERKRDEQDSHLRVYRPWGYYESLESGDRFQVKRLMVKPGARLSLQKHKQRAEHWVVVGGTARVTRGDEELTLEVDQSTYIPIGMVHRVENPGPEPLHMIEVQSGSYLGEDDIERLEDVYGRN